LSISIDTRTSLGALCLWFVYSLVCRVNAPEVAYIPLSPRITCFQLLNGHLTDKFLNLP
jgi:hypothetical protein